MDFGLKKLLLGLAIAAALAGAVLATAVTYSFVYRPTQAAPAVLQPQPGWIAPAPQFLAGWDQYLELRKRIREEQDRLQKSAVVQRYQNDLDLENGLLKRLQDSVPNGFTFDTDKRYFIPVPKPSPQDPDLGKAAAPPAAKPEVPKTK